MTRKVCNIGLAPLTRESLTNGRLDFTEDIYHADTCDKATAVIPTPWIIWITQTRTGKWNSGRYKIVTYVKLCQRGGNCIPTVYNLDLLTE